MKICFSGRWSALTYVFVGGPQATSLLRRGIPFLFTYLVLWSLFAAACAVPPKTTSERGGDAQAASSVSSLIPGASSASTLDFLQEVSPTTASQQSGCPPITVADGQGLDLASRYPNQFEIDEFENVAGCQLQFSGNPQIKAIAQRLPTALGGATVPEETSERLPTEPLIVLPYAQIGRYGGVLKGHSPSATEGTEGVHSWRHVNLVRYADDLQTIVPDVAKSWSWNETLSELTFSLRRGHKWSDGAPFTSADILFWYNDLVRHEQIYPELQNRWRLAARPMQVVAHDDHTVTFRLGGSVNGFLSFWATTSIQPFQPRHFLSQFHIDHNPEANNLAVAQGFANWVELIRCYYHDQKERVKCSGTPGLDSHVKAEENDQYRLYLANPYFHQVDTAGQQLPYLNAHLELFGDLSARQVIEQIDSGILDHRMANLPVASPDLIGDLSNGARVQWVSTGNDRQVYYSFNQTVPYTNLRRIFGDLRFRQATSLAINRQAIVESIYAGFASPMQATPGDPLTVAFISEADVEHLVEFDAARANLLLDQMGLAARDGDGYRLDFEGRPFVITLAYPAEAGPRQLHERVGADWRDVGINVEVEEIPLADYQRRANANEHHVAVWRYDNTSLPNLLQMVPNQFTPPFRDAIAKRSGDGWTDWYFACVHLDQPIPTCRAESGRTPPDAVKPIFETVVALRSHLPGSQAWLDAGRRLADNYRANLYHIGIAGDVKQPVVSHARVQNLPQFKLASADYHWNLPFRPAQWYVSE